MALQLVLPFLFPLLFAVKPAHSQGTCTHRYLLEPWTNPELATCNPHGSYNLTTVCSVAASESSFTLEWYYSRSSSNAGRSGVVLNNVGEKYFVKHVEDQLVNGAHRMLSHLMIINVTADDFGYYWCMVRLRNSGTLLPNPSMILHLSNVCASAPVCNSSIQLYHRWPNDSCANHDNMNITLPETLQCNQPTSMPDSIQPTCPSASPATQSSDNVIIIRAPDFEEDVKTSIVHSMKLLSPCSTVVYTEPLPTGVVSDGDSDTQLNWLYVGIAMAIVLTAVTLILILIICIQCKKWGVKNNLEKCEIEMQPNKAYETVTRPAAQVPVEPCPDYEALDH